MEGIFCECNLSNIIFASFFYWCCPLRTLCVLYTKNNVKLGQLFEAVAQKQRFKLWHYFLCLFIYFFCLVSKLFCASVFLCESKDIVMWGDTWSELANYNQLVPYYASPVCSWCYFNLLMKLILRWWQSLPSSPCLGLFVS